MNYINNRVRNPIRISTGILAVLLSIFLLSAGKERHDPDPGLSARAEQFFNKVYCGHPEGIDTLISDDFVSVYPTYLSLFNTPGWRGKEEFKAFATGFNERWKNGEVIFHETVAENNKVVVLWSFTATRAGEPLEGAPEPGKSYSWGGITIVHFDDTGKISAEFGLEDNHDLYALLQTLKSSK